MEPMLLPDGTYDTYNYQRGENGAAHVIIVGGSSGGSSGGLTDAELRAAAVPVSLASQPLPTGAATAALQTTGNTSLANLDAKHPSLVSGRVPVTSQDTNGEGAVRYITDTTAVTGLSARHVVCLTDTVFATFTRTGATGSITGVSLPAGTLLTGPVTAITLTSGAVAAYA